MMEDRIVADLRDRGGCGYRTEIGESGQRPKGLWFEAPFAFDQYGRARGGGSEGFRKV